MAGGGRHFARLKIVRGGVPDFCRSPTHRLLVAGHSNGRREEGAIKNNVLFYF